MTSILIVEDDPSLSESLSRYLSREGYDVHVSATLADARSRLGNSPGVLILDWMLPDGQGIDLLREIRGKGNALPTILLSARNELVDKVVGLETGANDYITKPFEPRELAARIRVRLRDASAPASPSPASSSGISLNILTREATYLGKPLELTKMEFNLLKILVENPNRVFPREALLNEVWGYDCYPTTRTVDNHILQLRQKISFHLFETVRGVGYRLREEKR